MNSITNQFNVKYFKVNQPTSTRYLGVNGPFTFEDVMVEYILELLCEKTYKYYFYEMIGQYVTMKRSNVFNEICQYSVILRDLENLEKVLFEYNVEIDCIKNNNNINLAEEKYIIDSNNGSFTPKFKDKKFTKWILNERLAVRTFLLVMIETEGDINKLKKYMSKATYHRHMKYCKEKGYIVDGKLVRKVLV